MTIEPGQRRAGKRGKLPARPDSMKLKFGDYLNKAALPTLPRHFGHVTNVPPGRLGWMMLGNDVASDCVIAGRCHEIMVAAQATGRPVPDFSAGSALADYSRCLMASGGPAYNPRDPNTDTGLDMQQAAKWWRDVGITDADGKVHKIDAYVAIDTVDDLLMAAYLCGSSGCGLALPPTAEQQFEAGQVWDDLRGRPIGGHYVPCVGLMGDHLVFVTWGNLQGATREYVEHWMEDAVCCLSREYLKASGLSPEAINWTALLDDVDALARMGSKSAHEQVAVHEPDQPVDEHPAADTESAADQVYPDSDEEEPPPPPKHHRQPDHKPKPKAPKRAHKRR
jgi:hypothetical protein